MKYTFEKAEKSTVKITIELTKEEWYKLYLSTGKTLP